LITHTVQYVSDRCQLSPCAYFRDLKWSWLTQGCFPCLSPAASNGFADRAGLWESRLPLCIPLPRPTFWLCPMLHSMSSVQTSTCTYSKLVGHFWTTLSSHKRTPIHLRFISRRSQNPQSFHRFKAMHWNCKGHEHWRSTQRLLQGVRSRLTTTCRTTSNRISSGA
jgi:hypothetical protein